MDCRAEVEDIVLYPPVINHALEASHIERLAKKWFGEEHFTSLELPLSCSEDFSYFIQHRPGAMFALGTMKPNETAKTLHTSTYDFNDNMIASGGYFYIRIAEDRLGIKVLKD